MFFLYGPAVLSVRPASGSFSDIASSMDGFQNTSLIILGFIILAGMAKGLALGKSILAFGILYLFLIIATVLIFTQPDGIEIGFFKYALNQVDLASEPNSIYVLIFDWLGGNDIKDRIKNIPVDSFTDLMLPLIAFWMISIIIIYKSIFRSWAGMITYRDILPLPYLERELVSASEKNAPDDDTQSSS